MQIKCPICRFNFRTENQPEISAICMFTKAVLVRYKCPRCGVILGPLDTIKMSKKELGLIYTELFRQYNPPDTTNGEVAIAKIALNHKPDSRLILNYGAGRKSQSILKLRGQGYEAFGYDPFAKSREYIYNNRRALAKYKFDIIYSNNLLEHLQDPIEELKFMIKILKPNGIMAHATACYGYKFERSPVHLYFFTGKSLKFICKRLKLKVISTENIREQPVKCFRRAG